MRAKLLFIGALGFIVAGTALVSVASLTIVPPDDDVATIQAATNIVFTRFVRETGKQEQIVVSDAKEVREFVSKIHLEPKGAFSDLHFDQVAFKGTAGELSAHFCPRCFTVQNQKGVRDYAMPKDFYERFLTLARQHGWKP